MKKELKVNKKFIELALRNSGYSNYSAIADILDNSLENEVDAKNVDIIVNHQKGSSKVTDISVIDDGIGMSNETLEEAMSLGSDTGKDEETLGMYGTGLKAASLSMGRRFSVYTKKSDSNLLLYAVFDIDDYDYENKRFNISYTTYNEGTDEYIEFCQKVNNTHGTIVKIDKLDQLSGGSNFSQFVGTLSKNLRVIFNKFIENDYCNIRINGKKLTNFDVIGNKRYGKDVILMQTGEIEIDGVYATWKAWNVRELVDNKDDDENSYGRGARHQGLYIYRQNRLVGEALTLGLYNRDQWYNGLRFELFTDGNSDKIFHTNYTKTINEKNKGAIEQAWADKLTDILKPLLRIIKEDQKSLIKNTEVSDNIKDNISKALKPLNADNLLKKGLQTRGKNENTTKLNAVIEIMSIKNRSTQTHIEQERKSGFVIGNLYKMVKPV